MVCLHKDPDLVSGQRNGIEVFDCCVFNLILGKAVPAARLAQTQLFAVPLDGAELIECRFQGSHHILLDVGVDILDFRLLFLFAMDANE
jgi:hypothetical protein